MQERIKGGDVVPPDPKQHQCDWCPERAVVAFEMHRKIGKGATGMGQFVFGCHSHEQTARRATSLPQPKRR